MYFIGAYRSTWGRNFHRFWWSACSLEGFFLLKIQATRPCHAGDIRALFLRSGKVELFSIIHLLVIIPYSLKDKIEYCYGLDTLKTPAKERGHNQRIQRIHEVIDQLYRQHTISQNTLTDFAGTCYHWNIQVYNYLTWFQRDLSPQVYSSGLILQMCSSDNVREEITFTVYFYVNTSSPVFSLMPHRLQQ